MGFSYRVWSYCPSIQFLPYSSYLPFPLANSSFLYSSHMNKIMSCFSLFVWPTNNIFKIYSLDCKGQNFHLFKDWIFFHCYMCPIFFVHWSIDEHVGYFQIVTDVTMCKLQRSLHIFMSFSLFIYPEIRFSIFIKNFSIMSY